MVAVLGGKVSSLLRWETLSLPVDGCVESTVCCVHSFRVHQIRFRPGAYCASPDLLAGLRGTLVVREGEGRKGDGRGDAPPSNANSWIRSARTYRSASIIDSRHVGHWHCYYARREQRWCYYDESSWVVPIRAQQIKMADGRLCENNR